MLEFGPSPGHLHVIGCLILSSGIINHNIGWDTSCGKASPNGKLEQLCFKRHLIRPFYKARAPVRLTQERPKCALHHGKMSTNKCRARYEITHEHVSNDLKMWIKRLHTEIHNIITIYIHYKSIYFKTITCIILGLVNSNVFACKTNSAFNDFVDSCVTGKRNRTGARAL